MRALHRDLGYFAAGLTVIYALSGIVQIYRDTDLLQRDTRIERKLPPDLGPSELGQSLHLRDLKVTRTQGDSLYFRDGVYDRSTGNVAYSSKDFVFPLNRFVSLHKASSKSPVHWLTVAYGALLFFLALSSFWMFRGGTSLFRRGMYLAAAGIVAAVLLLSI